MKSRPRRFVRSGLRGYHCPQFTSGDLGPIQCHGPRLRADRPGHAHPQPGARRPGRRRSRRASGLADGAHPWRQGGSPGGGHRACGVTPPRLPVGRAKFVRAHPWVGAAMAKPKAAGAGVMEREDIWARSVAPRLADWAGRPPGRRRVAPRRALLN